MKYNGVYALAEPLGNLMAECWPRWEARVDLILAIPLHPKRQRSRGYNQSDLLTEQLCARVDIPSGSRALKRTRDTRPQVDLNPTERLENVADAFWADAHDVAGKRVVMIDDVCTTGSTLMEAGKALLAAGAKSVAGYCLARVP
jgi:ComF family protein